jgi:hypothetical protein
MLIAILIGFGLAEFTNSALLGFLVGMRLSIVLVLGLPKKQVTHCENIND